MSWSNVGAGAAQGAAAGSVGGPWGMAIGAVAGGIAGAMKRDPKKPAFTPPTVIGNARLPGQFIDQDQGGYQFDPSTGTYYGVNPWDANSYEDMIAKYRTQAMQNMLFGGKGQDMTKQYDWETSRIQKMLDEAKAGKMGVDAPSMDKFGLDPKFINPKTGKLWDDSTPDGHAALRRIFEAEVPSLKYGGNSMKNSMGFWLTDRIGQMDKAKKMYDNAMEEYKGKETGFADRSKKTIDYYQNLLDTRLKGRGDIEAMQNEGVGGIMGEALGGAGTKGKYADPYAEDWDRDAKMWGDRVPDYLKRAEDALSKRESWFTDPNASMFSDPGFNGGGPGGSLNAMWQSANGEMQRTNTPDAPSFDPSLAGSMRTGMDFGVLNEGRNRELSGNLASSRRGMGGSSFNELNKVAGGMYQTNALNDNIVKAAQFYEDQRNREFGQKMQKAGLDINQEEAIANSRDRKFGNLSAFNQMLLAANEARYNRMRGESQYQNEQFDDWFQRGLSSQDTQNQMNNQTFGRKLEGGGKEHGERMDYLTYMRGMMDDSFRQDMSRRGVALQGLQTAGNLVGDYNADSGNREAANAGMQLQNNMARDRWTMDQNAANAEQDDATISAMGQIGGSLGASYGAYRDKKSQQKKLFDTAARDIKPNPVNYNTNDRVSPMTPRRY